MKGGHVKRIRTKRTVAPSRVSFRAGMLLGDTEMVVRYDPGKPMAVHSFPRTPDPHEFDYSRWRALAVATPFRSKRVWQKLTAFGHFICLDHTGRRPPHRYATWVYAPEDRIDLLAYVRSWAWLCPMRRDLSIVREACGRSAVA